MNLFGRAVVSISAVLFVTGCSITEKYYQGKCDDSASKIKSGSWELAKEVCFKDPSSDKSFVALMRKFGLASRDPIDLTSTQLWIEQGSLSRDGQFLSINYVQQAIFGPRLNFKPDLRRKETAKVNCDTNEFLGSNGKYRSIEKWKKPVLVRTPKGQIKDYSSPLNPYSYIVEKYCVVSS